MTLNLAALNQTLNEEFMEPMSDTLNRHNPYLEAIQKKSVSSQEIFIKALLSSQHEAGARATGSPVTVGDVRSNYERATLPWRLYTSSFSVDKLLIEQVQNQPGALGKVLASEIEQASKDLADSIAADIFAGDVVDGLFGMQSIMDEANTYAGIDRTVAANANWRCPVIDAADAEISTALFRRADKAVFDEAGKGFTDSAGNWLGVMNSDLMFKYEALFEDIDFSALSTAHFVNSSNNTNNLGRFGRKGYAGVPMIRDRNVTAGAADTINTGRIYIANMDYIHLCTLAPSGEAAAQLQRLNGYQVAPSAQQIVPKIEVLGNSGEQLEGYIKTYVQLASPNPRKAGVVIKNISNVI